MTLNKELLDILACPKCKGEITLLPAQDGLHCAQCQVVYAIKDDIPIMLVEEAVPEAEWPGGVPQD